MEPLGEGRHMNFKCTHMCTALPEYTSSVLIRLMRPFTCLAEEFIFDHKKKCQSSIIGLQEPSDTNFNINSPC